MTTNSEVNFDMLTLNENGPNAGRYLDRTHEVSPFAALSRIDLQTGMNELLVARADWESFDGLVWTPWGTILMAEEEIVASGISESRGILNAGQPGESGALFKFVPDVKGDLSSGKLYALKVQNGRTGPAVWTLLNLDPVTFDSDAAAQAVGATGWDRPEDIEIVRQRNSEILYVAVTESSNLPPDNGLVLKITLDGNNAFVSNFVEPGVNVAPESGGDSGTGFDDPDNLAIAPNGDVYITEDDSPSDIWVARGSGRVAGLMGIFARLRDCGAESTGIYFSPDGQTLWVNSQHAQLNNGEDLTIAITRRQGQ